VSAAWKTPLSPSRGLTKEGTAPRPQKWGTSSRLWNVNEKWAVTTLHGDDPLHPVTRPRAKFCGRRFTQRTEALSRGSTPNNKHVAPSAGACARQAELGSDLRATNFESAARAETEAAAAREAFDGSVAALNNYAGLVYDATRVASDPMSEMDKA